jgi:hypothetical protein
VTSSPEVPREPLTVFMRFNGLRLKRGGDDWLHGDDGDQIEGPLLASN